MSFFDKLKREIDEEEEKLEETEEEPEERPKKRPTIARPEAKRKTKLRVGKEVVNDKAEEEGSEKEESETDSGKKKWFESEGQLAVDVYQTERDLVIQSAIAGIKPEELEVSLEKDVVTIKGRRERPAEAEGEDEERNYFYQECYWGPFSREIILPEEVDTSRSEAVMKDGVLTIRMPKIERTKKKKIAIKIV